MLDVNGLKVFLPSESRLLLDGVTVDFADTPTQSGLTFFNPNAGPCACSSSATAPTPGVVKVDDSTVAFHLQQADGNFIDAVSPNNYNMVVVPNGFDYAHYQKSFPGTDSSRSTSCSIAPRSFCHSDCASSTPRIRSDSIRSKSPYFTTAARSNRDSNRASKWRCGIFAERPPACR